MSPAEILAKLRARGVELRASGGRLLYRPASAVAGELLDALRACKLDVLALLADRTGDASAGSSDGRRCSGAAEPLTPRMRKMLRFVADEVRAQRTERSAWPGPDALAALPEALRGLAGPRPGWTPVGWRWRLLELAARCERDHPARAAELRAAARILRPGESKN